MGRKNCSDLWHLPETLEQGNCNLHPASHINDGICVFNIITEHVVSLRCTCL